MRILTTTFGAGCFWHVEEEFSRIDGLIKTEVGYMGGKTINPSYSDVSSRRTGHAEVCRIEYDADRISYKDLLSVFWKIHDPTSLNRQGADIGSQYRSVIFFYDKESEMQAVESRKQEQKRHNRPIMTQIVPAGRFWKAEAYHQKYLKNIGINKG